MYQVDVFWARRQKDGTYRLRPIGEQQMATIPVEMTGDLATWWEGLTCYVASVAMPQPKGREARC